MPAVSTCGRFDNAPAHVILISPRFSTRELGTIHTVNDKPFVDPAIKAAKDEAKHREHQAKLKIKADLRKAREAIERLQKMELSRKHQREAKARKRIERKPEVFIETVPAKRETWIKALPRAPDKRHRSKEGRAIKTVAERERRQKIRENRIKELLPAGYVLAETVEVVSSRNAVIVALRTGAVPSMRFGIKWYCDPEALRAHCVVVEKRRLAALAMGRAKIAAMRGKK